MARMLGRYRTLMSCGRTSCRHCAEDGTTRRFKRAEARQAAREAAEALAVVTEPDEAVLGECRHGCNGDCVVFGDGSDVCDFLCHPGLELDESKAARVEAILRQWGAEP